MDCSPPGSFVHGILQAGILEWVAIPFSRGSSWPRDQTWVSCFADRFFTVWATTWEALKSNNKMLLKKKKKTISYPQENCRQKNRKSQHTEISVEIEATGVFGEPRESSEGPWIHSSTLLLPPLPHFSIWSRPLVSCRNYKCLLTNLPFLSILFPHWFHNNIFEAQMKFYHFLI